MSTHDADAQKEEKSPLPMSSPISGQKMVVDQQKPPSASSSPRTKSRRRVGSSDHRHSGSGIVGSEC